MSRRAAGGWSAAEPVSFNSPSRDFDPAFSADGKFVYFCSDRPGGLGGDDLWRVAVHGERLRSRRAPWRRGEFAGAMNGRRCCRPTAGPCCSRVTATPARVAWTCSPLASNDGGFGAATALPGDVNTHEDEFDATFLADGRIRGVLTRARYRRRRRAAVSLGFACGPICAWRTTPGRRSTRRTATPMHPCSTGRGGIH